MLASKLGSLVGIGLWVIALSGCSTKQKGFDEPKEVLSAYISKSFSVTNVSDKLQLAEFLGGDSKIRLLAWSDEQFAAAFIEAKRQFVKLVVVETKKVSEKKVALTYELTFIDSTKGKETRVTNKKLSDLEKNEQGHWLIVNVQNLKEVIEYQNAISLP